MSGLRHVVLVHGAFHRGEAWDAVVRSLAARDVSASAVDLPFSGYSDDQRTLARALDAMRPRRLIVCAHSSTGMLISDPVIGSVDHLVYVAAFMPEEGEDPLMLASSAPPTELRFDCGEDGLCTIAAPIARQAFYGDLDDRSADRALRLLRAMSVQSLLSPPAPPPLWKSVPSTYVVCANDRAFHPDLQRRLATRATAVVELDVGHSPFVSHPETLGAILAQLAGAA